MLGLFLFCFITNMICVNVIWLARICVKNEQFNFPSEFGAINDSAKVIILLVIY